MQHANGGGTEGVGACKRQFACPCPLLLHGPCLYAPSLAPPLLPFHTQGSPHPGSVQTGNVGRCMKGTPPPLLPLTPAELNRTAHAGPLHPNRAWKHRHTAPPLPLASCSCTHTSGAHKWGGGSPFPPFPHSCVCAKRAWGWTAMWETVLPPFRPLPAQQTGVWRRHCPPFLPPSPPCVHETRHPTDEGNRMCPFAMLLRFAKRCPTWTCMMWMQPLMTQLWSSDTRYSNTRSPLYVRRRRSTSTNIDKR
jgi:hypothetical protein